jgi:hypothetical protein
MNIKSILLSTITGTIVYFALGWLFYGILFTDLYPESNSMLFIVIGSIFYVLVFALIYGRWASISTFKSGAVAGLVIGLLYSLSMSFFMAASLSLDVERLLTEAFINAVSAAIMGGVVGLIGFVQYKQLC